MPFELSRLPPVELGLLASGALVIIVAGLRSMARGRLLADLRMPAPPSHSLGSYDIVLAVWAHLAFGYIFVMIAHAIIGSATNAPDPPAPGSEISKSALVVGGTFGSIGTAIVLVFIGRARFANGLGGWGLSFGRFPRQLAIALCVTLAAFPICYGILGATTWFMERVLEITPNEHASIERLRDANVPTWEIVFTALSAVVLAPIVEEMLFRGLLLPAIARWLRSPWMGLIVSSLLFGMIHYTVAKSVPALMVFGFILGATYLKSRSLTTVILVHALFNAKTILWLLLGWQEPGAS